MKELECNSLDTTNDVIITDCNSLATNKNEEFIFNKIALKETPDDKYYWNIEMQRNDNNRTQVWMHFNDALCNNSAVSWFSLAPQI